MPIVCATRFTEESTFAVGVAASLARKHHQKLWLVHVLPAGLGVFEEGLDSAAAKALEHEAGLLSQTGIDVHTAVIHGKLEQAVARFCREKAAALLVVGDTARRAGPIMASTLDKVAYGVETPLLVVRDSRPFLEWAAGKAPLKVMLALDPTSSSAVARDWISRLAEYGDLDLVATHIWWPNEEYERRNLPLPGAEEGHRALAATVKAEAIEGLRALPKNVKHRVHLEIGVGHVGEQLLKLANEEQVDVFVVGSHRRRALGRLWSVSHHVLALAPMSVACVPAMAAVPDLTSIPSFSTAVAATNLTEAGNRAISCALGAVRQGTVHVVHVAREPLSAEQEGALLRKLSSVLPPTAEQNGARVLVHVRYGKPAIEILKACQSLAADVVCLGLKASSLSNQGVVDEVLRQSRQPVLFASCLPD